jgi:hypothetical protein
LATEFHIPPSEIDKQSPEDIADFLSYHRLKVNTEAENSEEEKRRAKRKKGSRLQQAEDNVRMLGS